MLSVVIPTYKNKELLIKNITHNISFLKDCEIIIVNDDPQYSIKSNFSKYPKITILENNQNLGFSGAVARGIQKSTNHYIMLLNNDVLLHDMSYRQALLNLEKNQDLFAVSFAQRQKDSTIIGKNKIFWKEGFFQHKKAEDLMYGINAWAEGGSCMINKRIYEKIGGFDSLYSPFYWEDVDISYRAWKQGFQILFDPSIVVDHDHESTIGKYFKNNHIQKIAYRNQFIFIWKNINDKKLITSHILRLIIILPYMIVTNMLFVMGLFDALMQLKHIIKRKKIQYADLGDRQVLQKFI
ncbi:MAG: glycosyltransferase family 2 protein [Patescibacteria group bacterium]